MRDAIGVSVEGSGLRERLATRALLARTLSAIAAGKQAAMSPSEVADRLARDHSPKEGDAVWGLEQGLRALGRAMEWEPAVAGADANPARFRDAARYLAGKALAQDRLGQWSGPLIEALEILAELHGYDGVQRSAGLLEQAAAPAAVTDLFEPPRAWQPPAVSHREDEPAPAVLVRFTLQGEPVSWPMALNPGRAYRLGAVVKLEMWPPDAARLIIEFESPAPSTVIEWNRIVIPRGHESGEAFLLPKAEIGPSDSVQLTPLLFFELEDGGRCTAAAVGQRSLRVTTFDPSSFGSSQPMVAQRILELLSELDARIPSLPLQDRRNLVLLLDATTRFAALANERTDLRNVDEPGFQAKLKEALVQDRYIGLRIREAPKLGGGITDLLFERIVDELKVVRDAITLDKADRFVRQPTQYASAGDCPISMLTILDASPKADPPGIQSNYMRWAYPKLHGAPEPTVPSMVAVVIIPIGFPLPSDWSKGKVGEVQHGA